MSPQWGIQKIMSIKLFYYRFKGCHIPGIRAIMVKEAKHQETNQNGFKISVRDLVASADKPKDLGRGFSSTQRAMAGIREHIRIQGLYHDGWEREVPVSLKIQRQTFWLEIFGRMDGLLATEKGVIVQEIKTCQKDPARVSRHPRPAHLAQVKCYGYMTAKKRGLSSITLQLT